jgi:uncharacterized membrane protein YagU involved in acid resistance
VARISAVILIAGMVYSVAAWGLPLVGLPKRVDALEAVQPAQLFMSCVNFRDTHPAQLPAVCDQAISRGPR